MKMITPALLTEIERIVERQYGISSDRNSVWLTEILEAVLPVIVRKCVRELNAHHDEFIDGHNGKEYFEIVDEILVKVKTTLRELIEEDL